jgi:hypothetical protein
LGVILTPEMLESAQVEPEDPDLWAELFPVVYLFSRCLTQWRVLPSGGLMGLDYPSIKIVAEANDIPLTRQLLSDLQTMEWAALSELQARD